MAMDMDMETLLVPGGLDAAHADFSRAQAFVDGEYVALAEARISVRDLGFTRADATYDVLHTWRGGFFSGTIRSIRAFSIVASVGTPPPRLRMSPTLVCAFFSS